VEILSHRWLGSTHRTQLRPPVGDRRGGPDRDGQAERRPYESVLYLRDALREIDLW